MLQDYSEDYSDESPIEFSKETSNVVLSPKTYSDESLGETSEVIKGKYFWLQSMNYKLISLLWRFGYNRVLFYSYNLLGPLLTDPEPFDSTKQCKRGYNPYSYRKIQDSSKGDCYKGNCKNATGYC